ncbi:MAG: M48 family metallopeptidase [Pseudomonadales bacterium]|nr:M48 family metallopeptidase [Pseudomonadales bacterium]
MKNSKATMSFVYGDETITFRRDYRDDSMHKILIKVHPDCQVVVKAPQHADDNEVLSAVKKRGRWIYRQLSDFNKQMEDIRPRQYISGETHFYLGKQYLLKVALSEGNQQCVKLFQGKLVVTTCSKDSENVHKLLNDWYKTRAKETFAKRLDAVLEKTLWVEDRPSIRIQTMQTQWGSCSPAGRLTLNPLLVKAPRECIDYVILHELCHIAEHNHSKRFYRLMNQVMPNWESTKSRLDSMATSILNGVQTRPA